MAKATLPITKRITDAIDKIGVSNGTLIPDPDFTGTNEEVNALFEKHKAVRDLFVSSIVKKHAEAKYDRAKAALSTLIPKLKDMQPGDATSYVFGNMSLSTRAQKGQSRLNRQKLITKLMTDQKMTLEQAEKFTNDCEVASAPSVYLTPATVTE